MFQKQLRTCKELDRRVSDELGGLVMVEADHGLSKWFLLPFNHGSPFTYRRCQCYKCEWVLGRQPCYPSDVIRFFQTRHAEEVRVFIPPPASCLYIDDFYTIKLDPHARLKALMCTCPRCEAGRGSHADDNVGVIKMSDSAVLNAAKDLWIGKVPNISLIKQLPGKKGVCHIKYTRPYNRTLFENMHFPKPEAKWSSYGVPSNKRANDHDSDSNGESVCICPPSKRRMITVL